MWTPPRKYNLADICGLPFQTFPSNCISWWFYQLWFTVTFSLHSPELGFWAEHLLQCWASPHSFWPQPFCDLITRSYVPNWFSSFCVERCIKFDLQKSKANSLLASVMQSWNHLKVGLQSGQLCSKTWLHCSIDPQLEVALLEIPVPVCEAPKPIGKPVLMKPVVFPCCITCFMLITLSLSLRAVRWTSPLMQINAQLFVKSESSCELWMLSLFLRVQYLYFHTMEEAIQEGCVDGCCQEEKWSKMVLNSVFFSKWQSTWEGIKVFLTVRDGQV